MEKVLKLTQEQFDKFEKDKNQKKMIKELLSLPINTKIGIGDTTIKVKNSNKLDVFKDADTYYIIVDPIDEQIAIAYSIYKI